MCLRESGDVQVHMLENIIRLRLDLPQEMLGLFMHNGMIKLHSVVIQVLVKGTPVLPPPETVGQETESPGEIHSDRRNMVTA